MRKWAGWISLSVAVLAQVGCSYNPTTKRPELVLTSKETERELGEREALKIKATMGLVDDSALNSYIGAIGTRLVAQSPSEGFEFSFHVVDMKEPNAFALPGGNVYVSRGILALANSEDELAGVIGHEVAHVFGRHTGHRITVGAPLTLATGIGAAATSIVSPALGGLIGGIGGATQGLLLSPYDRHQERAADDLGLDLAAKAGWDPRGLSQILFALEREEDLQGGPGGLAFFASHPRTPDRVRDTKRRAEELERGQGKPIAATRVDFLHELDGLILGENPGKGVFVDELFVQPDLGFSIAFPKGWKTQNSWNQVVAAPQEEDAVVILRHAGEGDDPMPVAREAAKKQGLDPDKLVRGIEINGLKAVRSRSVTGRSGFKKLAIEATWVALSGSVYQVVSATGEADRERYHEQLVKTPHSFRRMTAADLAKVKVDRLRLYRARAGETMAALVERIGSDWKPEQAAIANGVEVDTELEAGQLIKLSKRESYRP